MASKGVRPLLEFNVSESSAPEWELYKRDFLIHLDALGLDDKPGRRKVGVLLANMGRESVKIYDTFTWAEAVEANEEAGIQAVQAEDRYDLETVFAKFDRHFGVHNYRNIKRQEFLNTKRGNMSIMDYISELKRKAEHCQYGQQKEGLICDMIINGVNEKKISEKLMEIPADELSMEKVMKVCRQVELTEAHLKTLVESPSVNTAKVEGKYCSKCCRKHEFRNCPAFNKYCDACGAKGHFQASKLCPAARRSPRYNSRGAVTYGQPRFPRGNGFNGARGRGWKPRYRGRGRGRGGRRVHYAGAEATNAEENYSEMFEQFEHSASINDVFVAKSSSVDSADWSVTFKVGNTNLPLEIDSGAMCNVMSTAWANKLRNVAEIGPSDAMIKGVSGNQVKAKGTIKIPCEYKGTNEKLEFQVMDTPKNINLLGRDDSVRFGLIMRVNSVKIETDAIIEKYQDVLGDAIGCLPGEYKIKVDPSVDPVVHAPRQVPVAIRDQLQQELDHLERCNIIAKVSEPTQWVSSLVCVRKKNGRVRICIDPTDLNKAIRREH